jgi:hypothetical protein
MNQIMAQAQQMQQKLQEAQAEIVASTVEGAAGNGLVKVTISGAGEVQSVNIDPQVVDPDDVETLQRPRHRCLPGRQRQPPAAVPGEDGPVVAGPRRLRSLEFRSH